MDLLNSSDFKLMSDIIYTANEDLRSDDSWSEIVGMMSRLVCSQNSAVVFCSGEAVAPRIGPLYNLDESFAKDYVEHYYKLDHALAQAQDLGRKVYRPIDVLPKEDFVESEFCQDFLRPKGVYHSVLMTIGSSPTDCVWVGLGRGQHMDCFTEDKVQLLDHLQRHLTQAYDKSLALKEMEESLGFVQAGMEQFGRPILIYEDDGRLIFVNEAAREFCRRRAGLSDDILVGISEASLQLIQQAINNSAGCPKLVFMKRNFGNLRCLIELSPVYFDGKRRWLAAVIDHTEHLRRALRECAQVHRLTSREMDICEELMNGLSNKDIAEKLFIAEFTVKDHFKNIANKLQISNRTELALKLLGF